MELFTTDITLGTVHLPFSLFDFLLTFLLPWVVIIGVIRLLFLFLRRLVRKSEWQEANKEKVIRWIRVVTRSTGTLVTIGLASRLLGAEILHWVSTVIRILNQPIFTSGNTQISVVTLILVIPVFYIASWLGRATRSMFEGGFMRRLNLDPARQFSMLSILRYTVMSIAVIVGFSIIGINLSSLAVLFGVLGIGVGFGLQGVVGNMFAGLVIIFARPIKEGDRIQVGELEGTVKQIKFIHTVVDTITKETIIIPNSRLTETMVHNYSYDDPSIIVCNKVQVSYSSDLDRVKEVSLEVAGRNPYGVAKGNHEFQVWSFDDSGITVRICVVIRKASERIQALSWTNLEIWRAFKNNGIEIPFPQLDLHVKREKPAVGTPSQIDSV